ncbi:MAG: BTAD domain-containing putative transcriptional regulator [Chloroflexota bacterium]
MDKVKINLLGSFSVILAEQPITQFRSTKAQALLAWLAAHPNVDHSRNQLATLLWGNHPESRAKTNLRIELSGLKKRLNAHPALAISRSSVRFHSQHAVVDLLQFQAALNTEPKTAVSLQNAVNMPQGSLLAGLQIEDAPDFEDWRLLTQERLHQQQMNALDWLTQHFTAHEQWQTLIETAQQQLTLEPWHEPAHRALLRGLVGLGQLSQAKAAYARCCQVLKEELGIEPSAATETLWRELQRAGHATVGVHNLPLALPPLFGRQQELAHLNTLLATREARLITLLGQGGSGKTRLALAAAHAQKAAFADGVWFVPLAGVDRLTAVIPTIADALNIRLLGESNPATQLQTRLRQKELLLILDNLEHLPEELADVVATLLQNTERLHIMTTSRRPLRLRVETRLPLGSLQPDAAHQLFIAQMAQLHPFTIPDEPIIERICALVGHLPLGIELAAAQLESRSQREIEQVLASTLATVETEMRDVPARQRSLVAVFESSWILLTPAQQTLLAQLAIFRGEFGFAEAEAVLGPVTRSALTALVQHSLLQTHDDRYLLHPVIQRLAADKLYQLPLFEQVATQHAATFLSEAETLLPLWTGLEFETAVLRSRQLFDNLSAAWEHALHAHSLTPQQINAMRALYRFRGLYHAGIALFANACQLASNQPKPIQGWLLAALAWFQVHLRQNEAAGNTIEAALALADQQSDLSLRLDCLLTQQIWHTQQDQYQVSVDLGETIVAAAQQNKRPTIQAAAQLDAGFAKLVLGAATEAEQFLREAEQIYRNHNHLFGEITAKRNLGIALMLQSRFEQAKEVLNEGLTLAKQRQDQEREIFVISILGVVHNGSGDFGAAVSLFQQQLAFERGVGVVANIASALANLAVNYLNLGQYEKALALYLEARPLMESESRANLSALLSGLSYIYLEQGEYEQTAVCLAEAIALAKESGMKLFESDCLYREGELFLARQQYAQSAAAFAQSTALREALNHGPRVAQSQLGLAHATLLQGDTQKAKQLVTETLTTGAWRQEARPHQLAFRAYEILSNAGDTGATELLHEAKTLLKTRAEAISNPLHRHSFLHNVGIHKRIQAA